MSASGILFVMERALRAAAAAVVHQQVKMDYTSRVIRLGTRRQIVLYVARKTVRPMRELPCEILHVLSKHLARCECESTAVAVVRRRTTSRVSVLDNRSRMTVACRQMCIARMVVDV
jgi:hypothetical protein